MSSSIPTAIISAYNQVTGIPLEKWVASTSLAEALFYTAPKRDDRHSTIGKIRLFAVSYINEIQTTFNLINFTSAFLLAKKITDTIQMRYSPTFFQRMSRHSPSILIYPPFFLLNTVCIASASIAFSIFPEKRENRKPLSTVGQVFQVAKAISSLACTLFSQNPIWLAVSIAEVGYSFWKSRKFTWSTTTESINEPSVRDPWVSGFTVTYLMLCIEGENIKEKKCSICLKGDSANEPPADSYFCNNGHAFHLNCSQEYLSHLRPRFTQGIFFFNKNPDYNVRNGQTTYSYEVPLPRENLPICPNCRLAPRQNKFEITVLDRDRDGEGFPCEVIIT